MNVLLRDVRRFNVAGVGQIEDIVNSVSDFANSSIGTALLNMGVSIGTAELKNVLGPGSSGVPSAAQPIPAGAMPGGYTPGLNPNVPLLNSPNTPAQTTGTLAGILGTLTPAETLMLAGAGALLLYAVLRR